MVDYRIHTFLTLYDTMNYRRTGELLRLSQPAVSQQIHALERDYGCKLFLYDGKRLHRTAQADVVAEYARAALYNAKQMQQRLQQSQVQVIRMGATKTIGEFVLPELLVRYAKESDGDLTVTVDNTENLLRKLEHEELDFALVEGSFDRSRYGFALYSRAPFVGICHRDHPFAGGTVTMGELKGERAILREKGSGTRAILENALLEHGYSVDLFSRTICVSSSSLVLRLVLEGAGITFAYAAMAERRPELACFHLEGLHEAREFNIVYLKGTRVSDLIRDFFCGAWTKRP